MPFLTNYNQFNAPSAPIKRIDPSGWGDTSNGQTEASTRREFPTDGGQSRGGRGTFPGGMPGGNMPMPGGEIPFPGGNITMPRGDPRGGYNPQPRGGFDPRGGFPGGNMPMPGGMPFNKEMPFSRRGMPEMTAGGNPGMFPPRRGMEEMLFNAPNTGWGFF
jgi:hypothetical protein